MQMTMMATPNLNKELQYLNKEDRLLRWLLIKHRNTKYGVDVLGDDNGKGMFGEFTRSSLYNEDDDIDEGDDDIDEDDDDMNHEESKEEQSASGPSDGIYQG